MNRLQEVTNRIAHLLDTEGGQHPELPNLMAEQARLEKAVGAVALPMAKPVEPVRPLAYAVHASCCGISRSAYAVETSWEMARAAAATVREVMGYGPVTTTIVPIANIRDLLDVLKATSAQLLEQHHDRAQLINMRERVAELSDKLDDANEVLHAQATPLVHYLKEA